MEEDDIINDRKKKKSETSKPGAQTGTSGMPETLAAI